MEYSVTCIVITAELWDHDRAFLSYRSDQRYDGSSSGILNRICAVRNYLLRLLKVIESDDTPFALYQKCALECIPRVDSGANNAKECSFEDNPDPRKSRKSTRKWSEISSLKHKRAFADRILSKIQETRDDTDIIAITEDIYHRAKQRFSGGIDMQQNLSYKGLNLSVLNSCKNVSQIPERIEGWSKRAFYSKEDKDLVLFIYDAVKEDSHDAFPEYVFESSAEEREIIVNFTLLLLPKNASTFLKLTPRDIYRFLAIRAAGPSGVKRGRKIQRDFEAEVWAEIIVTETLEPAASISNTDNATIATISSSPSAAAVAEDDSDDDLSIPSLKRKRAYTKNEDGTSRSLKTKRTADAASKASNTYVLATIAYNYDIGRMTAKTNVEVQFVFTIYITRKGTKNS